MSDTKKESKAHKEPYTEKHSFKFSGKMAKLLGQESVSSEVAAVFELVKNAYDADSEKVFVRFKNFSKKTKEKPSIETEDFGNGMTSDEIKQNWMVIDTYSKNKDDVTEKGRKVVGNKGIGRFATEKLSTQTTVISKPKLTNEEIIVKINWKEYEKEDITFNDIKNTVYINPNRRKNEESGIKIILENLREPGLWTTEKIKTLKRNISTIIPPKELASVLRNSFLVKVEAPDFDAKVDEEIPSVLFEHAPYKLISTIDEELSIAIVNVYKKGKK